MDEVYKILPVFLEEIWAECYFYVVFVEDLLKSYEDYAILDYFFMETVFEIFIKDWWYVFDIFLIITLTNCQTFFA